MKEEEKEENVESEIEVIKLTGVNCQRRKNTRKEDTNNAIGPNDRDKSQDSEIQSGQFQKEKLKAAVFKLILRMQDVVFLFISTCI